MLLACSVAGCVTKSVACGPGKFEFSPEKREQGSWQFERVELDGSVVVTRASTEIHLDPPPAKGGAWGPDVITSDYKRQTATLRLSHCEWTKQFLWWSWTPERNEATD